MGKHLFAYYSDLKNMKKVKFLIIALFVGIECSASPVPYLQTPTHSSIWVNWRTTNETESKVIFGKSENTLDQIAEGTSQLFSSEEDNNYSYTFHSVQLENLEPDTRYYYKVVSQDIQSEVYSFRTQPLPGGKRVYRFIILGDHQVLDNRYERLIKAARETAEQKYGTPVENHINLITNVGDQVDKGTLKQYDIVHFKGSEALSPYIPIMTIVGNHETYGGENALKYYEDHYKYENIEYKGIKSHSEFYYAMQQGRALFLMLSTEHTGTMQYNWAKEVIEKAKNDDEIDWILSYNHRPIQAEQYVGDISIWVRDRIIPLLCTTEKSVLNVAGHHHLYHRGQLRDFPMYHIISGGASWDQRWGQSTEKDFDDVQKTIDYWPFQIVELNSETATMSVETYIIGNQEESFDEPLLVDSFLRKFDQGKPDKPSLVPLSDSNIELPYTFESTPYSSGSGYEYNSVQFQVAGDADFSNLEFDLIRDYENIFGKHPGNAQFVDIHRDVDIFRQKLNKTDIYNGEHYIHVRHRDRNMEWSEWSDAAFFITSGGSNGSAMITRDQKTYFTGEEVKISYINAFGDENQWIGIYEGGQQPGPSTQSTQWKYISGTEGKTTFQMERPGVYFAVIFRDNGYDIIAKSELFYAGSIPGVDTDKIIYQNGENVKVSFHGAPKLKNDWIGIYNDSEVPGSGSASIKWVYVDNVNGSEYIFEGLPAGDYFVSYFIQDKYFEPGERVYFKIADNGTSTDIIEKKKIK